MAEDRILWAEYCDDVRHEVGNKFSLIGVYGADMFVTGSFPLILPKLCAFVRARTPLERPFKAGVLRICRDEDQVLAEMPIQETVTESPLPGARWQVLSAVMMMSPFPVESPVTLYVVLETEGEQIRGPKLRIRLLPAQ